MQHEEILKKMARTKYKELLRETVAEYKRMTNFVRIYPSPNSNSYDQYFEQSRPFNKYIHRMLYTDYFGLDDQAKLGNPQQDPAKLEQEWEKLKFGYKVKMPQEYVKKNQYKSTQKADDIDYQICPND